MKRNAFHRPNRKRLACERLEDRTMLAADLLIGLGNSGFDQILGRTGS